MRDETVKRETKQDKLIKLLKNKGSVDLLDLQKGTHGVRTSNPASMIFELRKKGYDITTYENTDDDGKYISTVYKLNFLPLPEDISDHDSKVIEQIDKDIVILREKSKHLKECRAKIIRKY